MRAHPDHKLLKRKRSEHRVDGAALKTRDTVLHIGVRADDHHRQPRVGTVDHVEHREPVAARYTVKNYEIDPAAENAGLAVEAVGHSGNAVTLLHQAAPETLGDRELVSDYKNTRALARIGEVQAWGGITRPRTT